MTAGQPRPAATLILLRERDGVLQVLLQQRPASLAFGGQWAFPGGVVEPADAGADLLATLRNTARREAFEETGLRLAAGDALVCWARWITPAQRPRRFDTWFFAAAAPDAQPRFDAGETLALEWRAVGDALEGGASGALPMLPPTYITLADLGAAHARQGGLADLLRAEANRPIVPLVPRIVYEDGAMLEALMPWSDDWCNGADMPESLPDYLRALPPRLRLPRRPG